MRKFIRIISLILVFSFLFVHQKSFADDPIRKLSRGVVNTASGWVEVFAEIFREQERSADFLGLVASPFKGIAKAIGRTVVGVYEVTTFIIPIPSRYRPIVEPEFVF